MGGHRSAHGLRFIIRNHRPTPRGRYKTKACTSLTGSPPSLRSVPQPHGFVTLPTGRVIHLTVNVLDFVCGVRLTNGPLINFVFDYTYLSYFVSAFITTQLSPCLFTIPSPNLLPSTTLTNAIQLLLITCNHLLFFLHLSNIHCTLSHSPFLLAFPQSPSLRYGDAQGVSAPPPPPTPTPTTLF